MGKDEIRRVDPVTARLGHLLKTFDCTDEDFIAMKNYAIESKKAAKRNGIKGEVVWTKMVGGHPSRYDTYQVFFLRK